MYNKRLSVGPLVGPSVNLEFTVSAVLPDSSLYIRGEKNQVARVTPFTDSSGMQAFEVCTLSGERVRIVASDARTLPAGSSINVGVVLRHLGAKDVTVFAPVGRGDGGSSVTRSMEELGVNTRFFFGGNGTPRTLTVRDPSGLGSTLFCAKQPYMVDEDVLKDLKGLKPKVLIITSVKPSDLHLVEELFLAHQDVPKVIVPHSDLIKSLDLRSRFLGLIAQADLLQLNESEACQLLGAVDFRQRHMRKLSALGARLTIVTMGSKGSAAKEIGCKKVIKTRAETVTVVDSSGAGDTHLATMVYYRYLRLHACLSTHDCLEMASWIAGQKVRHVGSWQGIPSQDQCEEKVRRLARHA